MTNDQYCPVDMTPQAVAQYTRALTGRERHGCVYHNPDDTFHLLLVDDSGGSMLVDQIQDEETAHWPAALVDSAPEKLRSYCLAAGGYWPGSGKKSRARDV